MIIKNSERQGITKILSYLNNQDLNDLMLTITNRMIQNFKEDEFIPLILNYSQDALNFLRKKKIKKELIFRYLNNEQVYPKSNSTKSDLIRECLKYWGSNDYCEIMEIDENQESEDDQIITSEMISDKLTNEHLTNQVINSMNQSSQNYDSINHQANQPDSQIIELSINFGEWFYSLLPQIDTNFNVNNFWPDSQSKIILQYYSSVFQLTEIGNLRIVELLKQINQSGLRFKPNLLPQFDGVQAEFEEHGLLKVVIHGILYFDNEPVGCFDHLFGLISESDLEVHNWRIKCLDMQIKLSKPLPSIQQFLNSIQRKIEHG